MSRSVLCTRSSARRRLTSFSRAADGLSPSAGVLASLELMILPGLLLSDRTRGISNLGVKFPLAPKSNHPPIGISSHLFVVALLSGRNLDGQPVLRRRQGARCKSGISA